MAADIYPSKGTWSATVSYKYLDSVYFNKVTYVCVTTSSLNERPDKNGEVWVALPQVLTQDEAYLHSREDLLLYEDARFTSLMQAMANFYITRNDQTIWGNFLRAVAMELARIEYMYAYDIVAKDPQYLTPPDIKRKYANVLSINRAFPQEQQFDSGDFSGTALSTVQTPIGYRDMLVNLLKAYRQGATSKSIEDVIFAYTGKSITVEELYTQIANGFYDQSDRNAIKVSVNVGGNDPWKDVESLTQLQDVVQSLYGAIDLAKPAHVGLEFTTILGTDENVGTIISGITDTLEIIVQQFEQPPFNPMLYQAPIFDANNPKTTLAAYGQNLPNNITLQQWQQLQLTPITWSSTITYKRGEIVRASAFPNANCWLLYRAINRATDPATRRKLPNLNQNPVADTNAQYWQLVSSPSLYQAYYWNGNAYSLGISTALPSTTYYTGQYMVDYGGNLQIATTGGVSGSSANVRGVTVEGNLLTVVVDSTTGLSNNLLFTGLSEATFLNGKSLTVQSRTSTSLVFAFQHADYATTADTGIVQTAFTSTLNGVTTDGTVTWQCLGANYLTDPVKWIALVNKSVMTGEVTNWDADRPFGLVAPRQDLAWEISGGDTLSSYEMT